MSFCTVDERSKPHLIILINWLFDEVISAGGDGDAFWYSRYFSTKDLLPLVEEVRIAKNLNFDIVATDDTLTCHSGQECLLITNKESTYLSFPSWGQVKIVY